MIKYGLLTAEDSMASEFEVYEFLYALVRLLKPKVILETGCYKGGASMAMARAAEANERGRVITCETNKDLYEQSPSHVRLAVSNQEGVWVCQHLTNVDLAFIDSSGDRIEEVRNLQLTPHAVVVLHDSKRPQYKPIWTLRPWKSIWEIDTEQGITVFQL